VSTHGDAIQSTNGLKKKPLSVESTSDNRLYVTDGLLIRLTVLGWSVVNRPVEGTRAMVRTLGGNVLHSFSITAGKRN
jgi:hypothetical protein